MLKALLDRILELSEIRTFELGGSTHAKVDGNRLGRILLSNQVQPKTLIFNNLSGLVDYFDRVDFDVEKLFYVVTSPTEVSLMSSLDPTNNNVRFTFATATLQVESFRFGNWYDLETFIINLLSLFEQTEKRDATIEMMANIANEHVVQNTDDKFSQSLQVKSGLTTKANEVVENPITLIPFRTFREIEQPESNFILRYQNRKGIEAALFEGDGGCWKLDAILRIKNWLTEKTTIPVIG